MTDEISESKMRYDSMDEAPRQIFDLYKNVNFPDHSDVMGDLPLTPRAKPITLGLAVSAFGMCGLGSK